MAKHRKDADSAVVQPVTRDSLAPAVPADSQPILPSEKRNWTVGLETLPDMTIEADSQADAVRAYNEMMGIIATEHAYRVS